MALLVIPPIVEPMTPEDARLRLRYPRTDQDVAIAEWISAARNAVERYVERGIMTQTWELRTAAASSASSSPSSRTAAALAAGESTESHRDFFARNLTTYRARLNGGASLSSLAEGAALAYVDLPWAAPLQAIESVIDEEGEVPPEDYIADSTVEPARMYWLTGARPAIVRYRVGYGDLPSDVPANLKQTIFALVQQYFLWRAGPPPQSALDATLAHADGFRVRGLL